MRDRSTFLRENSRSNYHFVFCNRGWLVGLSQLTRRACVALSLSLLISEYVCLADIGSRPAARLVCLWDTALSRAHPHVRNILTFRWSHYDDVGFLKSGDRYSSGRTAPRPNIGNEVLQAYCYCKTY